MRLKTTVAALGLLVLLATACAAGAVREGGLRACPPPGETGGRWVVTNVRYEMEGDRVSAVTLRIERVIVRHAAREDAEALAFRH